jgi:hypothetical protein
MKDKTSELQVFEKESISNSTKQLKLEIFKEAQKYIGSKNGYEVRRKLLDLVVKLDKLTKNTGLEDDGKFELLNDYRAEYLDIFSDKSSSLGEDDSPTLDHIQLKYLLELRVRNKDNIGNQITQPKDSRTALEKTMTEAMKLYKEGKNI